MSRKIQLTKAALTTLQRLGQFAIIGGGFPALIYTLHHFMDHGNIFSNMSEYVDGSIPTLFWFFVALFGFVTNAIASHAKSWILARPTSLNDASENSVVAVSTS
ncbi:hypothetical protein [Novipirellula maiorica]|nr:hypothetical protein [Rhodopirellula maiorica]